MRAIRVFLRVVTAPLLSGVVIFSAPSGASTKETDGARKPTVVKTDASDRTEAQQSSVVYRKAWAGHKTAALPQSKLIVRAEGKHGDSSEESGDSDNTV